MSALFMVPLDLAPGVQRTGQGFFTPGQVFRWTCKGDGDNPRLELIPMNEEALELLEKTRAARLKAAEEDFERKKGKGKQDPEMMRIPEIQPIPPDARLHPVVERDSIVPKRKPVIKDVGAPQTLREASGDIGDTDLTGKKAKGKRAADSM